MTEFIHSSQERSRIIEALDQEPRMATRCIPCCAQEDQECVR